MPTTPYWGVEGETPNYDKNHFICDHIKKYSFGFNYRYQIGTPFGAAFPF